MAQKTHDLVVKVGEYQTRDGQTKARYENIGALMHGDKGPFIMLKRTFNPAGVPNDGRDNILISAFEPRDNQQQGQQQSNQQSGGYGGGGTGSAPGRPDFDDDVPF